MAQRIQPMSNIPYAAEAMAMANVKRGNGAMNLPNAGVPNAFDGGAVSKAVANPQPQLNMNHQVQNQQQNGTTAVFQAQAGAAGEMRKGIAAASNASYNAQSFMNANIANTMLGLPSQGRGMMAFQAKMEVPIEKQKLYNDLAVSSAMAQNNVAGELTQGLMEANRYG